ncbi:MAG: mechanosensitive ion channel family protein [Candidatus Promineifilaceae bacterium]
MIEIGGVPIQLPDQLSRFGNIYVSMLLSIILWLVIMGVIHYVYYFIGRPLARRTVPDVDDTILEVLRFPVLLIVGVIGAANILRIPPLSESLDNLVVHIRDAAITLLIVLLVWRFFREVILYYGAIYAARTETKIDDVLLPIVHQLGRIIILLTGFYLVLRYLGIDLTGVWVALGGAAFILAFALQDILSNIFSGMSLIVDTPFKYGDLIELADGKTCRVERIGVRSTELYNVADNTVIYMPNSSLANERLLNITKPNTDLRATIKVSAPNDRDPGAIIEALEEIAQSHPNVLSPIPRKIELLERRLGALYAAACRPAEGLVSDPKSWQKMHDTAGELLRLGQEHELNLEIDRLEAQLETLAMHIDAVEAGGLSRAEKGEIGQDLAETMAQFGRVARQTSRWLMSVRFVIARRLHCDDTVFEPLETIRKRAHGYIAYTTRLIGKEIPVVGSLQIGRQREREIKQALQRYARRSGFEGFDGGFTDADIRLEFELLVLNWNRRLVILERRLRHLYDELEHGNEQRLDDRVRDVEDWILAQFKETTPDWKYPTVTFTSFGEDGLEFQLQFQIDDISREHVNRKPRVETELRREVWALLNPSANGSRAAGV